MKRQLLALVAIALLVLPVGVQAQAVDSTQQWVYGNGSFAKGIGYSFGMGIVKHVYNDHVYSIFDASVSDSASEAGGRGLYLFGDPGSRLRGGLIAGAGVTYVPEAQSGDLHAIMTGSVGATAIWDIQATFKEAAAPAIYFFGAYEWRSPFTDVALEAYHKFSLGIGWRI